MSSFMIRRIVIFFGAIILFSTYAQADPLTIVNGEFETGTFAGWTLFTTPNGTTGGPAVVPFDITGSGATFAARFLVGQVTFVSGDQQGGGIFQQFVMTSASVISLHADIASQNVTTFANVAGGLFSMLL